MKRGEVSKIFLGIVYGTIILVIMIGVYYVLTGGLLSTGDGIIGGLS